MFQIWNVNLAILQCAWAMSSINQQILIMQNAWNVFAKYHQYPRVYLFPTAECDTQCDSSVTRKSTYSQTDRQPDRQTDRQTDRPTGGRKFFLQNTNIHQKERIFFFTHAITRLSLFTYSVCNKKVKIKNVVFVFQIWNVNLVILQCA